MLLSENLSVKVLCLIVMMMYHLWHLIQAMSILLVVHWKNEGLGQLQCYADELPAHLCDEEEDAEEV